MIRVAQPADPLEAQHLLGVLESHGIRACVQGEALWAARGELPLTPESAPSIWVNDEADAERARQILEEHRMRPNPTHCPECGADLHGASRPQCPTCKAPFRVVHTWTCPSCSEIIGSQFTHCWNCGAERGDRAPMQSRRTDPDDLAPSWSPSCSRCGGTGLIERQLLPAILILCGLFLGFAAIRNVVEISQLEVSKIDVVLPRAMFAGAAVLCIYFARRVRRMACPCRTLGSETGE